MSYSMTYLISSFYCSPTIEGLLKIWCKAWFSAFFIIFTISPLLQKIVQLFVKNYK